MTRHGPPRSPGAKAARFVAIALGSRAAAVAEVVLLAWLIGQALSDRYGWSQYLAWVPTPLALAAALLGLLASWRPEKNARVRRRRRIGWCVVLVIVAGRFGLVEHKLLRRVPAAPENAALTIAHWDVGGITGEEVVPMAAIVERLRADVVVLSSGDNDWNDSLTEEDAHALGYRLLRRRAAEPHYNYLHVLVRDPLDATAARGAYMDLRHGRTRAHRVTVTIPGLAAPIDIDITDLPSDPRSGRMHIADGIRKHYTTGDRTAPHIVVGDLNLTRGGAAIRHAYPAMRHAYDDGGGGYAASFHRGFPLFHIDHVLVGAELTCARYELIDPGVGRHFAQRAWIVPRR